MTVYGICHSIGTSWSIASETNLTYDQHKILIRFSNVRPTYLLVEMKMDATLFYIIWIYFWTWDILAQFGNRRHIRLKIWYFGVFNYNFQPKDQRFNIPWYLLPKKIIYRFTIWHSGNITESLNSKYFEVFFSQRIYMLYCRTWVHYLI